LTHIIDWLFAVRCCLATLRRELADNNRENSVSRLIPHYRLGIVRSVRSWGFIDYGIHGMFHACYRARNLAANLQEQLIREQKTSQVLREQLEATYNELRQQVHSIEATVALVYLNYVD
jgi:non-ribosomal peptide synthetase component F